MFKSIYPFVIRVLPKRNGFPQICISTSLQQKQPIHSVTPCWSSQITTFNQSAPEDRKAKISKAMRAYLERAQEHDNFMKEQTTEYEIGKRHLANMMGVDPETFGQDDVDSAIQYLMPSGLLDKKARPLMKHPKDVFPKKRSAEFDSTGRPYNTFFYTGHNGVFTILHSVVEQFENLNEFEDRMIAKGIAEPPAENKLYLSGSEWILKDALNKIVLEDVSERYYNYFILSISRLSEHPYSFRIKDFIMQYRKPLVSSIASTEVPPLTVDEQGRPFAKAVGSRKKLRVDVTVWGKGTGVVNINGKDIKFFRSIQDREQLAFPLQFTGLLNQVDIEAIIDTTKGGHSGWAGAIRHGISLALRSFVAPEVVEDMRVAGLLQRDFRTKERKKPGQAGARKKYTWKKR